MYYLLIILLLLASIGLLIAGRANPGLARLGYVLPLLALLLWWKQPEGDTGSHARWLQQAEAGGAGEQLARVLVQSVEGPGVVIVLHPHPKDPRYASQAVQQQLNGFQGGLTDSSLSVIPLAIHEGNMAPGDDLTDGTYVGVRTLNHLLEPYDPVVAVALLGLSFAAPPSRGERPPIPPLLISGIADSASAQWLLDKGWALAAIFEKDSVAPMDFDPKRHSRADIFNHRYELRTAR